MHPVLSRQQKADGVLGFSTVMAAALIALAVKNCVGCGGDITGPALSAADYESQQLACIVEAGSKQEADYCRCMVQVHFGRVCTMTLEGGVVK